MRPLRMRTPHRTLLAGTGAFLLSLVACGETEPSGPPATNILAEIRGVDSFEWNGLSLGPAGDVNGDGRADIQVSALATGPGGRIGVFFGPLSGTLENADADLFITGELTFSNAGQSLVEAGGCDFDGDQISDLLIGAPFADRTEIQTSAAASGDNAGRAYLIYGKVERAGDLPLSRADHVFFGEKRYDAAGTHVACLGDIDGDGFDDIAISSPRSAHGEQKGAGAVYLFYGRARSSLPPSVGLESADAALRGEGAYDGAGTFVGKAGDHNGDGRPDFIIGAPGSDLGGPDSGAVYVLLGDHVRMKGTFSLAQASHVLFGRAGQRLGMTASRAGDVDGDGGEDLLIGGSPVAAAQEAPGEAYLISGRHRHGRFAAASVGVTLAGIHAGDGAGIAVATLGDVTGDRRADLLVGAPGATGEVQEAGAVYLIPGRQLSFPSRLSLGDPDVYVVLRGQSRGDALGETVRELGDLDGDGFPELGVSARAHATAQTAGGAVYILSGKALGGR